MGCLLPGSFLFLGGPVTLLPLLEDYSLFKLTPLLLSVITMALWAELTRAKISSWLPLWSQEPSGT